MRSVFNIILFCFFGASLSFCSLLEKSKAPTEEDAPKYDNYHSSGVYDDLKKDIQEDGRDISSEDYSDDAYGDLESDEEDENEELFLNDADEPEDKIANDPLPVEKLIVPKKKVRKKVASISKFKNGMYKLAVNCTMRSKASTKAKGVGKARKGKKLWMERHNKNWVKVFKKSGPVYINKLCL